MPPPLACENGTTAARRGNRVDTGGTVPEQVVLVLQGGGALGAFQAGAYEALCRAGQEPDWVAGISIGSINAALIAGNRPGARLAALRRLVPARSGKASTRAAEAAAARVAP